MAREKPTSNPFSSGTAFTIEPPMQLALSTTIAPPPIPVWGELSGNLRQGFTTKNQAWNPGPNVVNSTTAIGLRASLFLEGFRQSHSARYYNPLTGRFMGRDPNDPGPLDSNRIPVDPKALHKYLYAGGDPVNEIDPLGREGEEDDALLTTRNMSTALRNSRQMKYAICVLNAIAFATLYYENWYPRWEAELLLKDAEDAAKARCSELLMGWPGW